MRNLILMFAAACFILAASADGDEVLFKNKDRLTGKIVSMVKGKLVIDADKVGEVTVELADVSTFSTDEPVEILFTNETVLKKKVKASTEGKIILQVSPSESPLTFKISDIDKINAPKTQWKGAILAGATITRGNTYTQTASASVNAVRKSEVDRITFLAGYNSGRQRDEVTKEVETNKRNSYMSLQYDYFFTERLYGYANAKMERDEFADLDLRFLSGAGAGYQIFNGDDLSLAGEAGISWVSEDFKGPTKNEDYFSARLAYNLDAQLTKSVNFFNTAEWYPSLEDNDDHYVKSVAGIRSSLTSSLFAEVKAEYTWDSSPALNKKRTDVIYLLSVGWSF